MTLLSDQPAGPWLAEILDEITPSTLPSTDLPDYLQACRRITSWTDAQITEAVAEMSRRADVECPAAEVALALCEPRGAAATCRRGTLRRW